MPNRILKESITTSDSIDALTLFEEVFFYRLVVSCDDYGRMDGRAPILRARLFPLKNVSDKQINDAICSLCKVGILTAYTVDGRPYVKFTSWDKHQQIRAKKSKYPDSNVSDSTCYHMISNDIKCARNPIQSESNPNPNTKGETTKRERFVLPTLDEVKAYCEERHNKVNAQTFVDFYASKGWKVGNQPMRDWKAAVRTWEKRESGGGNVKTVSAQQYTQRQYTESDYDDLYTDVIEEARRAQV